MSNARKTYPRHKENICEAQVMRTTRHMLSAKTQFAQYIHFKILKSNFKILKMCLHIWIICQTYIKHKCNTCQLYMEQMSNICAAFSKHISNDMPNICRTNANTVTYVLHMLWICFFDVQRICISKNKILFCEIHILWTSNKHIHNICKTWK